MTRSSRRAIDARIIATSKSTLSSAQKLDTTVANSTTTSIPSRSMSLMRMCGSNPPRMSGRSPCGLRPDRNSGLSGAAIPSGRPVFS